MKTQKCENWRERILPYLSGELSLGESLGLRGHLLTCQECRRERDALVNLQKELRSMPYHPVTRPAPWANDDVARELPPDPRYQIRPANLLVAGVAAVLIGTGGFITAMRLKASGVQEYGLTWARKRSYFDSDWRIRANFNGSAIFWDASDVALGTLPCRAQSNLVISSAEPAAEVRIGQEVCLVVGYGGRHEIRDSRNRLLGYVQFVPSGTQIAKPAQPSATVEAVTPLERQALEERQDKILALKKVSLLSAQIIDLKKELADVKAELARTGSDAPPVGPDLVPIEVSPGNFRVISTMSGFGAASGVFKVEGIPVSWFFSGVGHITILSLKNEILATTIAQGSNDRIRQEQRTLLTPAEYAVRVNEKVPEIPTLAFKVGENSVPVKGYGESQVTLPFSAKGQTASPAIRVKIEPLK